MGLKRLRVGKCQVVNLTSLFAIFRLNTTQLDRLAYVNANLRVLEKVGALDSGGTVSWTVKQIDHKKIVVKSADIPQLQPHTSEDDVYDFIREDMMRFTRQTRSATRRRLGEASGVAARGASTSRGTRRGSRGRSTQRVVEPDRLTPTPSECESESDLESSHSDS